MAADLFAIDTRKLDFVGARHDPISLLAKVGVGAPTDLTMINGRIVWHKGEFPGIDEGALFAAAEKTLHTILPNTTNGDNHV
jgi:hydroxyatrazine ethylaminohydrolase